MKYPLASEITKKLINNVLKNTPNSIGISGENGSGKLSIAKYVVMKILEINKTDGNSNITILECSEKVGIEQIRSIKRELAIKSAGKEKFRRAVILNNFEQISHEAQNSMLKILEEPPEDTIFVITCTSTRSILPTITSRLSWIRSTPLSYYELEHEYKNTRAEKELKQAYILSDGFAGTFKMYLSEEKSTKRTALENAKKNILLSKTDRILTIESIIKNQQYSVTEYLEALLKIYKALLASKFKKYDQLDVKLLRSIEEIHKSKESLKHNPNMKLLFTSLMHKI